MNKQEIFAMNLKALMSQLHITSIQLAHAINVDPSLVSRWRKAGCGERKMTQHALAIGKYVSERHLSAENAAWLAARLGETGAGHESNACRIARWLYPEADIPPSSCGDTETFHNVLMLQSFREAVIDQQEAPAVLIRPKSAALDVCQGTDDIAQLIAQELGSAAAGTEVSIFLSSESSSTAVNPLIVDAIHSCVVERQLKVRMLVQSSNNSAMSSRLVSAYIPMLVLGKLELSVVQGTPQTFTATLNIIIPFRSAIVITEAAEKRSSAVAVIMRDPDILDDMRANFQSSLRYARPMMSAYDDNFARTIIETFFEEYGVPGSLDVIKSGLNPMYMSIRQYGKVLEKFGHTGEQYRWRYQEFSRFKEAMDSVLKHSRFREVLSLTMLHQIAETGRCRMPSMYFMEAGVWNLDAEDCLDILDGYIHYLRSVPSFQVILLDDEALFMPNSCWHIKNNKHVMIHSWNIDHPVMVYSDQLLLIDEFQRHFEHLWGKISPAGASARVAIEALEVIRSRVAARIPKEA